MRILLRKVASTLAFRQVTLTHIMPSGKAKSKAKSKQEQAIHQDEDDLAMSEEEMYRIIRETGIMGQNSTASREPDAGFVTMRASELPEARFEELAEDSNDDEYGEDEDEAAATGLSANVPAPRKLVQLIDQDEGLPLPPRDFTEAAAEGGNTVITLADIEDDETFKTILWMVVFSTLWLCL